MDISIKTAISILRTHQCDYSPIRVPALWAALDLGIQALQRLQDNREDPEFDHYTPLPAEDVDSIRDPDGAD